MQSDRCGSVRKTAWRLARSLALAVLALSPVLPALSASIDATELDTQISKMMTDWDQPGLALAIVSDAGIVHERGFGVRNSRTKEPVDAQTLFGIASVSKSFAAASMAKLVAEGRLQWDDTVIAHIPGFQMPQERDTPQVTLRDLLSMRSGLASSEFTFRRVSADRADHVRRIRFLQQLHPLRSEYLYTTDSYTAIGEVVANVTGHPWESLALTALWQPLHMTRTNADHTKARSDSNFASPHLTGRVGKQPIEWIYEDYNALPAGGVNSTAHDLGLWLQFQINDGAVGGKQLIPAELLRETRRPQTAERGPFAGSAWAEVAGDGGDRIGNRAYAMGWHIHTYRGHDIVWHSGGIDGFRSLIGFIPDLKLGIVVLTNADQPLLAIATFQTAIDLSLGRGTNGDWSRRLLARARADRAIEDAQLSAVENARLKDTKPSLPLSRYAGTFADNGAFGKVEVRLDKGHLVIAAGRMQYDLAHWHHDVFKARPRWPYEMESRNFFVDFHLDEQARLDEFRFSTGSVFNRLQ